MNFLNSKDTESVFANKRKLKDVDISDLSRDNMQDNNHTGCSEKCK